MANYLLTQTGEEVQGILNQAPETEAGLQQEVTNREQAITAEQQAREQAIAAEATAREQAIATEATARQQAIAAEATARADADDALDTKIDVETTRAEGAEGTLDDKIDQEVTDRTAAVAAEATARQQADTAQQQALAQETSRAQQTELANAQAISTNAQALQAEANTRQNADTVLQDHIDDEEERAKAAETTLQSNIDAIGQTGGAAVAAERERAQAAESTLDGKIDAETDRAEGAEGTLNDAIAQEVTDRTAAVAAEATARTDADAALQTAINGKQDTIADLADIRSGAAAGATAYQKPTTGIPATDMSAGVQTSLDKADSALQEHQSLADYYTKSEVDSLITTPDQEYVSVTANAQTTAVTDLLPATGAADTIYRVGNWDGTQYDPTMYALFAWNGTTYVCLAVRSFVGEVYDISVNHPDGQGNPTPYADLTAALGTDGANIPADIRRGGMSIKFIQGTVQSSDNKYVQCRLMTDDWSTNPNDWSICGNDVLVKNPEYVYVITDKENKIIFSIKKDGSIEWSLGVPTPIKDYISNVVFKGSEGNIIDGLDKVIAFLSNITIPFGGAKVSILGDSISTFNQEGYKIEGYDMYYPRDGVNSVSDTWWMRFINDSGSALEVNASDGGSTASTYDIGFSARVPLLGTPDIIFVELGTNDSIHQIEIGDIDFNADEYDLTKFAPAYIKGMQDIIHFYPATTIVCTIFSMAEEYAETIKSIAEHYGAICIDVRNSYSGLHPNYNGMQNVFLKISEYYNEIFNLGTFVSKELSLNGLQEVKKNTAPFSVTENPEWMDVTTDNDGKVLGGRDKNGIVKEYVGLEYTKEILQSLKKDLDNCEDVINIEDGIQINNGLKETCTIEPDIEFDKTSGLVCLAYGNGWKEYGETCVDISIAIFPLVNPNLIKFKNICNKKDLLDVYCPWTGEHHSYEIKPPQCSGVVYVFCKESCVFRIIFRVEYSWVYVDYDYNTDTLGQATFINLNYNGGNKFFNWSTFENDFLAEKGIVKQEGDGNNVYINPILQEPDSNGRRYTAYTGYNSYPILMYSDDDFETIVPFAAFPRKGEYEASFVKTGNVINLIQRNLTTDFKGVVLSRSTNNGSTWSTPIEVHCNDNNKPRIMKYGDKVIAIYGYSLTGSDQQNRQYVRFAMGDSVLNLKDLFYTYDKWGNYAPFPIIVNDEMYIAWTDAQPHLAFDNVVIPILPPNPTPEERQEYNQAIANKNSKKDCVKYKHIEKFNKVINK